MARNPTKETAVYVNGKKTTAEIVKTATQITVSVFGTSTTLSATAPDGTTINITADGVLEVRRGSSVSTATDGFGPYSPVETWCYSSPIKLGVKTTNSLGETDGEYRLPPSISTGNHRLVIRGSNATGQSITIGFAMRVTEESLISRIATSPAVWVILTLALLLALFIPGRVRRRDTQ
jgi:hypothetical protein